MLVLILGSDTQPHEHLRLARQALQRHGAIIANSDEISAPSYIPGEQGLYVNQALALQCSSTPQQFKQAARAIEAALGRRRGARECSIDIDIVAALDADGRLAWVDHDKLSQALFVKLACDVLPADARHALTACLASPSA